VEEALKGAGPVVELGVGTGRIAIPTAAAGVPLIGVDSSPGMLAVARARAEEAGLTDLLDLREGDFRRPPVTERVELVTAPFRSLLHLGNDADRRETLAAAYELLVPGGRFVFDVFAPSREDIEETHDRWVEREPGIWERAVWDEDAGTLTLTLRGPEASTSMQLAWLPPQRWEELLAEAGFEIEECYGWFDRRPYDGHEDSVWICRRP
jgi:SAM-dependent methyltransferase